MSVTWNGVVSDYLLLAGAVIAYGIGNLLQAVEATRAHRAETVGIGIGLLLRLSMRWRYLVGVAFQGVAFLLAFAAREHLPLFLVQAASVGCVGVTAVLGTLLFGWKARASELATLVLLAGGILLLVGAAAPSHARDLTGAEVWVLAGLGVAVTGGGVLASRLHGARGAVVLGSLTGVAFGAVAVAARPLASVPVGPELLTHPLTYVMVGYLVLGQVLFANSLQRGNTTGAVAACDSVAAIPAAVVGLLLLGDQVVPGRELWVPVGLAIVIAAVIALTAIIQPQHEASPAAVKEPGPAEEPDLAEEPTVAEALTAAEEPAVAEVPELNVPELKAVPH